MNIRKCLIPLQKLKEILKKSRSQKYLAKISFVKSLHSI